MTRPDPIIRPFIPLTPSAISPRDPNNWLAIAATIFFAIGFAVAVQL